MSGRATGRFGILGGAFNPPHFGHLNLAARALEQLGLDQIFWVPTRVAPHKNLVESDPGPELRAEMVEAAIERNDRFALSRAELDRAGVSYAIDTARLLREAHGAGDYYFLIGADALNGLPDWRDVSELSSLCRFAVYGREGTMTRVEMAGLDLTVLRGAQIDFSSRDIRGRLERAEGVRYMVPDPVLAIVERDVLYCGNRPEGLDRHIGEVERTAVALAERWGIVATAARAAARYHDAYRHLPPPTLLRSAETAGIAVDEYERAAPILLHGPLAAHRAASNRGVLRFDEPLFRQMLEAIRHHTTGRPVMNPVEEVLFVADRIGKEWPDVESIPRDRNQAVREAVAARLRGIERIGARPHPRMAAVAAAYAGRGR